MAMGFNQKTIKMKLFINIFIFFLVFTSCESKSQNTSVILNKTSEKMETVKINLKEFDIDDFEKKIRSDEDYYGYIGKGGVEIQQLAIMDEQHLSQKFDRKFVLQYVQKEIETDGFSNKYYFNVNGRLEEFKQYFFDVETGIWKTYSKDGEILTTVDKDKHYPFSIRQVIEFSKKNKGDLSKAGSLKRLRDNKSDKFIYEIEWVIDEPAKSYTKAFILDGTTGVVIKEFEKSVPWIGR